MAKNTFSQYQNSLSKNGVFIANNPMNSKKHLLQLIRNNEQLKMVNADESAEALNLIREWIENGKIKPVIDQVYPLSQIAEAHRHYESGHAKGRVVIGIE